MDDYFAEMDSFGHFYKMKALTHIFSNLLDCELYFLRAFVVNSNELSILRKMMQSNAEEMRNEIFSKVSQRGPVFMLKDLMTFFTKKSTAQNLIAWFCKQGVPKVCHYLRCRYLGNN